MSITNIQVVTGYYDGLGTPAISTAVSSQLSAGWIPEGAPILTDVYGQVAQVMVKSSGLSSTAYTVASGTSPMSPDATWNTLGNPVWIESGRYLQAYTKGDQTIADVDLVNQVKGVLPVSKGGTGVNVQSEMWNAVRPTGVTPLAADPISDNDAATKRYVDNVALGVTTDLEGELNDKFDQLEGSKGFLMVGGKVEEQNDIRAYVQEGDVGYTPALKRAIASGKGSVYINVPVDVNEDLTIPKLFRLDIDTEGYITSTTNKVRIEGFINSVGGKDPYKNYIHPFGVSSDTVPGVYTYNVVINVPEDYPTMQAAIDAVPDNYWQFITIQVSDGTYNEDLVIRNKRGCTTNFPPESGQQAILVITSKSKDRTKVSYRSAQVVACGGTPFSPNIENLNFTNRTHSDENCSVEFYGCTSGAVNKCSFNGVGVDKCVEAYNSVISVEGCDFGTDINDKAMVVKHGGVIMSNSTRIGSALTPMSGVLKSWVAVAIGGTILANDFGMCIGKVAQTRIDGVQVGIITETATKSVDGITSFSKLATTRLHTQFQDYDKYINTVAGSGAGFEYYPTGGLIVRAGLSGGSALLKYRREFRLVNQFETGNYIGFAVAAIIPSGVNELNGHLISGSLSSGNYFGIKYVNNTAYGVICSGGSETSVLLSNVSSTRQVWTCKYVGKGTGTLIFMFGDVYAGHINGVKLTAYDGAYFEANITRDRIQLYELEFVSTQ